MLPQQRRNTGRRAPSCRLRGPDIFPLLQSEPLPTVPSESQAGAQASAADLEAIRLSTQATLAQNYFQLCALDAQKKLLDATVGAYQKTVELTNRRYVSGVSSRADVLLAETQLKTTQAQAIDLGVQRAQLEHAIALLVGKPPSGLSPRKEA